jgi:hypothetical protein
MRSETTTCLFETARRAEATAFLTRLNLKESYVVLNFYERFYAIRALLGIDLFYLSTNLFIQGVISIP